jgi:peptidoglycan/LPS O-acetylase OafA/YrhL
MFNRTSISCGLGLRENTAGSVVSGRPASAATTDEPYRFRYLQFLDGLRAISILLVLGFHEMGPLSTRISSILSGWAGVDVFFVISGFLITSLLVQEREDFGAFSFRGFYVRRCLRIWPAYYAFLLAMLLWQGHKVWRDSLISSLYLTNIAIAYFNHFSDLFDHTWSLAVEEQFYLIWPAVLYLAGRRAARCSLTIVGLVWAWRLALLMRGVPWNRLTGGFDTKLDILMIGCSAALLWSATDTRRMIRDALSGAWTPVIVVVALIGVAQTLGHPSQGSSTDRVLLWSFNLPVFAGLVAVLILALLVHPGCSVARFLSLSPMIWLGRLSYSLYLWHPVAFRMSNELMRRLLPAAASSNKILAEASRLSLSIAFAVASYYLIEKPFLVLKRRFEPSRTGRRAPSGERSRGAAGELTRLGVVDAACRPEVSPAAALAGPGLAGEPHS